MSLQEYLDGLVRCPSLEELWDLHTQKMAEYGFDRLIYGYVLDFLNMSCCGITNPFVFNLADVFIFVGAIGLVLFEGRDRNKTLRDPKR